MCLILLAVDAHPEYPLVLAANRDEFYARPTAPAAPWPESTDLVGGRDLRGGGTWLGVTREGRWAAVTNVRDPARERDGAPSRGHLVSGYLLGNASPEPYLRELALDAARYNGFNLLVGDRAGAYWYGNRAGAGPRRVDAGVHGLSNAALDTPWPKVVRGRAALERALGAEPDPDPDPDALLDLLLDEALAADHDLPSTGLARELERALSASFIRTADYGTRSSTALLIRRDGAVLLAERTFTPGTTEFGLVLHRMNV